MANTVHGPFTPGAATSTGPYGTGVGQSNAYTSGNANNAATQSAVALASFNPDLIGAGFVLSGVACTKDGTTASQLDVASGKAYLVVSDGTLARCDVASTTFSTSGHPSTTMYLDLNPDGSWSWSTSHSAVANHLTICSVTTDGSANIATVTDARVTTATLFGGMAGNLALPNSLYFGGANGAHLSTTSTEFAMWTAQSGAAQWLQFIGWNGSATTLPFGIGNAASGMVNNWIGDGGGFGAIGGQPTAGSFGVPVIVAQANNVNVTTTALTTVLSYTPSATGFYRISGSMNSANGGVNKPNLQYTFTGGTSNTSQTTNMAAPNGAVQNGSQTNINNWDTNLGVQSFYAKGGSAITVQYQNNSGTPNDHVTIIIERLA